jgi:hypothetical protein
VQRLRIVASAVVGVAIVVALLLAVGIGRVADELVVADPLFVALAVASMAVALVARVAAVSRLLAGQSVHVPGSRLFGIYAFSVFLRNAIPWGRTAGSVLTAYLVGRYGDGEFEENLAVLVAAESLSFLASLVLLAAGGVALLWSRTLDLDGPLAVAAGTTAVLVIVVATVVSLRPTVLTRATVTAFAVVRRLAPRVPWPRRGILARTGVGDRVSRFRRSVAAVGTDADGIGYASLLSQVGWLATALPLYLSLLAVGADVPVAVALFVAPTAGFAAVVPLPGGVGSVDVALVGLLVALTGTAVPTLTAAVVVYRVATFWFPVTLGAGCGVALGLSVDGRTA